MQLALDALEGEEGKGSGGLRFHDVAHIGDVDSCGVAVIDEVDTSLVWTHGEFS